MGIDVNNSLATPNLMTRSGYRLRLYRSRPLSSEAFSCSPPLAGATKAKTGRCTPIFLGHGNADGKEAIRIGQSCSAYNAGYRT
ncbi:hypothetical protein F5Y11DRAFT_328495 [Daldinia sp. FL1419]|nr:hypothetical protein F5Y11DRAFT_328495 [Daldinia sp. FL1419]